MWNALRPMLVGLAFFWPVSAVAGQRDGTPLAVRAKRKLERVMEHHARMRASVQECPLGSWIVWVPRQSG